MQEGNKKKKWDKPKLIILIRGKPEERVLMGCKGGVFANPGSSTGTRCDGWIQWPGPCTICSAVVSS